MSVKRNLLTLPFSWSSRPQRSIRAGRSTAERFPPWHNRPHVPDSDPGALPRVYAAICERRKLVRLRGRREPFRSRRYRTGGFASELRKLHVRMGGAERFGEYSQQLLWRNHFQLCMVWQRVAAAERSRHRGGGGQRMAVPRLHRNPDMRPTEWATYHRLDGPSNLTKKIVSGQPSMSLTRSAISQRGNILCCAI